MKTTLAALLLATVATAQPAFNLNLYGGSQPAKHGLTLSTARLGQLWTITATFPEPAGARAAIGIGLQNPNVIVWNSRLQTSADILLLIPPATQLNLPVPNNPSLSGLHLYVQAFWTATALPSALSDATLVVVGT